MDAINIDWKEGEDVPDEEVRDRVEGYLLKHVYEEDLEPSGSDIGIERVNELLSNLDELEHEEKLAATIERLQLRVSEIADSPIEGNRYSASLPDCSEVYGVKVPREIIREDPDYCLIRVDKSSLKKGRAMPRAPLVACFDYEDVVNGSGASSLGENPAELQ